MRNYTNTPTIVRLKARHTALKALIKADVNIGGDEWLRNMKRLRGAKLALDNEILKEFERRL